MRPFLPPPAACPAPTGGEGLLQKKSGVTAIRWRRTFNFLNDFRRVRKGPCSKPLPACSSLPRHWPRQVTWPTPSVGGAFLAGSCALCWREEGVRLQSAAIPEEEPCPSGGRLLVGRKETPQIDVGFIPCRTSSWWDFPSCQRRFPALRRPSPAGCATLGGDGASCWAAAPGPPPRCHN